MTSHATPPADSSGWSRTGIDPFILRGLQNAQLRPAPPADRRTWLRRVTLDLVGLPPSPEDVAAFDADHRPDAETRVVDRLLSSPRYGERWGQHWLDVVRYADTHGYEVNTERTNAWPYRDYVIDAFNRNTPYDRFIREQIAGDATGQDAATGFLITASVLLPGQIGADEPSKRLARQDALDEIVMNIGQSFLGLSVGCARCHDHKFDPITQRDYYSMQAFVAGVEYEDRELQLSDTPRRKEERKHLGERIETLDRSLARFVPIAQPGEKPRRQTDARSNTESFAPEKARFVRFTILDANVHPTLGRIEPCIDEFEIFAEGTSDSNLALASRGTRVTASGSRTSDQHRLEHLNDGKVGNSHSWMSDEAGRGWVLFELPRSERLQRVVWSRDREGVFSDRLPTAFRLELGETLASMHTVAELPTPRPAINPRSNTDRFAPVKTSRIRFTIRATNNLEPCLDELEVIDVQGRNVALASLGTRVTSSGDSVAEGRHELRFINDGVYGNSHSWMSSNPGKGWVEIELPQTTVVDRVVWGRDREGVYLDRTPTSYRIEIQTESGEWQVVASELDRLPFNSKPAPGAALAVAGLEESEAREVDALAKERDFLQQRLRAISVGPMAFAGLFRKPDDIRWLYRGDPEQPRDRVVPAVLSALGTVRLREDAPEAERRRMLSEWIASESNPLTARVAVNRIWQGHFATGLVDTPSDFGRSGSKPSHPELLDWLASEFVRSGWSVKAIHRLITLSATYRQSAVANAAAMARDADNRLLWRFPSRRLEAETLRDSMLEVSGRLSYKTGGPGFDLFDKRGGLTGFKPVEVATGDGLRRMIYAHKVRREREAVFGAFDCPDAGQTTARRRESTTPIQALNLMNSRFTLDESQSLARRVRERAGSAVQGQITEAFRLALGREPSVEELANVQPRVERSGLEALCRALFNSNEFVSLP